MAGSGVRTALRIEEPGVGRRDRHGGRRRAGGHRPGDRCGGRRVRGVVRVDGVPTLRVPLRRLRAHVRAAGVAGQAHDRGAGQADPHGAQRGALRSRLPPVVRRRGQAGLRRDHPVGAGRPALLGAPPTGRRGRRHHAVELPDLDDHPQGRPRAGRRLHGRPEAGRADAAVCRRDVPRAARRRVAPRGREPGDVVGPGADRRGPAGGPTRSASWRSPARPRWASSWQRSRRPR